MNYSIAYESLVKVKIQYDNKNGFCLLNIYYDKDNCWKWY